MMGFLLSPAARADLEGIWDYTARTWGEAQAERYILAIRQACMGLADGTRQGRPIDEIRAGYRKLAVESHFLFYRLNERGVVDVVRILHRRMDVPSRLAES